MDYSSYGEEFVELSESAQNHQYVQFILIFCDKKRMINSKRSLVYFAFDQSLGLWHEFYKFDSNYNLFSGIILWLGVEVYCLKLYTEHYVTSIINDSL